MIFPKGVQVAKVVSSCVASHYFFLTVDGRAYAWGRNEERQLGTGDDVNAYTLELVKLPAGASKIVGGACGFHSSYLFGEDGDLYACGENTCGQLGLGSTTDCAEFKRVDFSRCIEEGGDEVKITAVASGKDFTVACAKDGTTYSWGSPQYGQLGNGTEGKTLEKAGKESFAYRTFPGRVQGLEKITQVACGLNHTLAMDDEGRVYSWGFAGYGRLGLGQPKDQLEPMAIPLFSNEPAPPNPNIPAFAQRTQAKLRCSRIACGTTCSYAILREPFESLYFWGITKKAGESTTKPTLYDELQALKMRDVSVGVSSTICVSQVDDPMVITWGCSPTYGELGYGDKGPKSSTKVKEVDSLKNFNFPPGQQQLVASGFASSFVLLDYKLNKKIVDAAPEFKFQKEEDGAKPAAAAAGKKKAAATTKKKAKVQESSEDDEEGDE